MQWKKNSAEVEATCNVKIAGGLYKLLVICNKESTGKDSTRYKMHGIWKYQREHSTSHMQCKKARAGNRKLKATCTLKMQCKDFARHKSDDLVENKKNSAKWVSEDFCLGEMV